jgi:hypothetical protein
VLHWPKANLSPLADRMSADCSEEKCMEFFKEVKPVAEKLVNILEQE